MRIRTKHAFHGAALAQIVEHDYFSALNRADEKYGHYVLNLDTKIVLKYCSNLNSPWVFTFGSGDMAVLETDLRLSDNVFVCLVCGSATVCALDRMEIGEVLDVQDSRTQSITIRVPKGGSMHVRGTRGELQRAIPHSSFPSKLFR
jgi:CRISPR/Cas system CMR subunit Cmr6 (Cas7 group RAMP superfamily)